MSLPSIHAVPSQPDGAGAPIRVGIVGGGFGGLYCALALHRRLRGYPHPVQVTLVEPRDRFTFTPLLYELLTHELKPWEIAPAYRDLLHHTTVDLRQDWVEAIDLTQQQIALRQGEVIPYDYLVVASGSCMRPPSVSGSEYALPFHTLEDAWELDRRLAELEQRNAVHIIVAGAGPSGIELACKLADRLGTKGHITILERRAMILRSYPPQVQRAAAKALAKRGIQVYTQTSIREVRPDGVTSQCQDQTHRRQADLVLWTVGTVPRPWLGTHDPKQTPRGQCLVRPTLQFLGHDNVFVVGDLAAMPAPGRNRAPMTAQAAFQAAPVVAHNIWALVAGHPLSPFIYNHLGDMLTLGQGEAVVCGFGLCITGRLGALSRRWAYWLRLPTFRHRWRVLKGWLGRGGEF